MKLSIIIPVYNEQERVKDCIKYMESQTVKPEVIFVDGGSRDSTVAVIRKAMKKNKNFRLLFEKGAVRSVANASNTGWKAAAGEAMIITGVDTLIEPDFTKKVLREFEKHPESNVIRFISKPMPPERFKNHLEKAMFYKDERGGGRLIIFRRKVSKTTGMYDPKLGFGDDKNFWKKLLSKEKVLDVKTEVKFSKSATLGLKGIAQRYLWYGRTIPLYLSKNKDNRTLFRTILSCSFVVLAFTWWLHIYLGALFLLLLLLPLARGFGFGINLWKRFRVKSPMFILPFTEVLGFFFVGLGVFKRLIGDKAIGR